MVNRTVSMDLLNAWGRSGDLTAMLGMLADLAHRGHAVDQDRMKRVNALLQEAEKLTSCCITEERCVAEATGE